MLMCVTHHQCEDDCTNWVRKEQLPAHSPDVPAQVAWVPDVPAYGRSSRWWSGPQDDCYAGLMGAPQQILSQQPAAECTARWWQMASIGVHCNSYWQSLLPGQPVSLCVPGDAVARDAAAAGVCGIVCRAQLIRQAGSHL